jgi:hypothetical protein
VGVSPLQLVNLHRNRRYFVIKLHTWFCLSYFLKTKTKFYSIYQYFMSINRLDDRFKTLTSHGKKLHVKEIYVIFIHLFDSGILLIIDLNKKKGVILLVNSPSQGISNCIINNKLINNKFRFSI